MTSGVELDWASAPCHAFRGADLDAWLLNVDAAADGTHTDTGQVFSRWVRGDDGGVELIEPLVR